MRHGILAKRLGLVIRVRYRLGDDFDTIRRHAQNQKIVPRSFVEKRIPLLGAGPLATQIVVGQEDTVGQTLPVVLNGSLGAFFVNSGTAEHYDRIGLMQGRADNQKPRRPPRNQHPNAKDQGNCDKPRIKFSFEQTAFGSAARCKAGLCPAV